MFGRASNRTPPPLPPTSLPLELNITLLFKFEFQAYAIFALSTSLAIWVRSCHSCHEKAGPCAFRFSIEISVLEISRRIYIYTYIYVYRKKGNVVGERLRREIVISVSPDCGPLTSRRLEPACHGINHNARICTRLGCARVRVGALTVRLNAINAPPPLDSRRREASPIAANDRRIELTVSSNPAPRQTVHCVPRQGTRGGERYLESCSRFFSISPRLPPHRGVRMGPEEGDNASPVF